MNETKLKQGIIITLDEKKDIELDGLKIKVLPAYEWLALSLSLTPNSVVIYFCLLLRG